VYRALYRLHPREALNCGGPAPDAAPGPDLAARLRDAVNRIKGAAIDPDTGRVDYPALADSAAFADYVTATYTLRRFDAQALTTPAEKMAFWINLYNALIIHAVIAYGVQDTITAVRGVFERAAYVVGGWRLSADDIEHGILRANAGHPFLPGPRFAAGDPRRALCLDQIDPRLHFTLNCGAASCPPIGAYQAGQLDQQLELATRHFLNSGSARLDREKRALWLSRLFAWYAGDFGGGLFGYRRQAALVRFVAPYLLDDDDRAFVQQHAEDIRVRFLEYDWSLNM